MDEWSANRKVKSCSGVSLESAHRKAKLVQRCFPMDEWSAHRKTKLYGDVSLWMSGQPIERLKCTAVCPFG